MIIVAFGRRVGFAHVLALAVFVLAFGLRALWFHVSERSPDEELYTHFAAGIAQEGPAWQVRLVRQFNRGDDVDYPWTNRFGFMALIALAMRITGHRTVQTGELLSTLTSLLAIAMVGAIGFESLDPWIGVIAMLFLAVSPLDLGLARRAWQDDVMSALSMGMLWTFLRAGRGGRLATLSFFAIAGLALIVKESSIIPFGLGVAGLAFGEWRRTRAWKEPARMLAFGAATGLLAAGMVIALSGGWNELRTTLELSKEANAPDDYMRQYQSGGVGYYLTGFRILQPLPFLLGYLAAALALAGRRWPFVALANPRARSTLIAMAIYVAAFSAVSFSYFSKNLRFLSPIYGPIALLGAAFVVAALRSIPARVAPLARRAAIGAAALALLASAARDVERFHHYFIEYEIQDLATPWFTQVDSGKI